jgi:hypothetical protein
MKIERRESLETINVTAESMVPWRRPPSCREASNARTGGEHRGSGDGMSAKEQVVNTGSPIWWEERSQPEFREKQTGPNRVAERSVVAMKRVTIVERRDLSSRSTQKQQEPGRLTRVYKPQKRFGSCRERFMPKRRRVRCSARRVRKLTIHWDINNCEIIRWNKGA